jgi:DNA-binding transcriptional MerR regulator
MARSKASGRDQRRLTISQLARQFRLSRSTLLYYDRLGLLRASARSAAGYRLYGEETIAALERIVRLRSAGMPLAAIRQVLHSGTPLADALEKQLDAVGRELSGLREQQRVALSLLEASTVLRRPRVLSKELWTEMFRSIGMSDEDMRRWHAHFERSMPDAHQDFLESLGLDSAEIRRIRNWSAQG